MDELDASSTIHVLTFVIDCRAKEKELEMRQIYSGDDVTSRNQSMLPGTVHTVATHESIRNQQFLVWLRSTSALAGVWYKTPEPFVVRVTVGCSRIGQPLLHRSRIYSCVYT